jgi:hypothetical protein
MKEYTIIIYQAEEGGQDIPAEHGQVISSRMLYQSANDN